MYEGVLGRLVFDAELAGMARRYVGMIQDGSRDGEAEFVNRFAPMTQVRKHTPELDLAVKAGDLKQHGPVVVANSHGEAETMIGNAIAKAKPGKKGEAQ